jgi:hypothetical protein
MTSLRLVEVPNVFAAVLAKKFAAPTIQPRKFAFNLRQKICGADSASILLFQRRAY